MTARRLVVLVLLALAFLAGGTQAAAGTPDDLTQVLRITDPRVIESSGLAASTTLPGVLWTINDSGDQARVFGIADDGETAAVLTLRGARARDWEAVGVGPREGGRSWLWIADIGDNRSSWPSVRVYRVPEPKAPDNRDVPWTAYELKFPDGPRDAEALLVDPNDGRLYIVSKRVQGAAIYRAPARLSPDRVNLLTRVAAAPPLVTDGSFAPDGRLALRDYLKAYVAAGVGEPTQRVTLPPQPQGESITWTLDGAALLVGSEGSRSVIWRVPVQSEAEPSASPTPTPREALSPEGAQPLPLAVDNEGESPGSSRATVWLAAVAGLAVGGAVSATLRTTRRRRVRCRRSAP